VFLLITIFPLLFGLAIADEASGLFANPGQHKSAYQGTTIEYQVYFFNDFDFPRIDVRLEILDDELGGELDIYEFTLDFRQDRWVTLTLQIPDNFPLGDHDTIIDVETQTDTSGGYSHERIIHLRTKIIAPEIKTKTNLPISTILIVALGGLGLWSYLRPWYSPLRYIPLVWIWGTVYLDKDGILANPIRMTVFDTVREIPGISIVRIEEKTGFSKGAIRYALDRLIEFELIKRGDYNQFYSLGSDRPQSPLDRLPQTDQTILYEIRENHLKSQKELASRLKMASSTVGNRLYKLVKRGYLRPKYWGRTVTYEILDPSA